MLNMLSQPRNAPPRGCCPHSRPSAASHTGWRPRKGSATGCLSCRTRCTASLWGGSEEETIYFHKTHVHITINMHIKILNNVHVLMSLIKLLASRETETKRKGTKLSTNSSPESFFRNSEGLTLKQRPSFWFK